MVLEDGVDKRFYLGRKTIERIMRNAEVFDSVKGGGDTAYALGSNDWKGVGNKPQRNIIREGRMEWLGRGAVFNITPGSGKEQPIPEADRIYYTEGVAPPVKANDTKIIHNVYGGFKEGIRVFGDYSPTIRTPKGGGHIPMVRGVAYRTRNYKDEEGHIEYRGDDVSNQITTVQKDSMVEEDGVSIRRLTPVECERLQGFPDGWTAIGREGCNDNLPVSDTQRYKMLGNAVTVNVIAQVASRILDFEGK